jgi:hypothetical protein
MGKGIMFLSARVEDVSAKNAKPKAEVQHAHVIVSKDASSDKWGRLNNFVP